MKRKLAIAAASFAITLALGRGAIVSISTNTTLGGGSVSAGPGTPTSALQQEWWGASIFHTNVFLHDKPNVPLHERLAPFSTNDIPQIESNILAVVSSNYIPKWPAWYQMGYDTSGITPSNYNAIIGLFRYYGVLYLQNIGGLSIAARGSTPAGGNKLRLHGEGGVVVSGGGLESTCDVSAASFTLGGVALEEWRGQLQGPNWLTPARFDWEATIATTVTTNIGPETDHHWAVLTRAREVVTEKEYILDPDIERNQWDATLETSVDGPATLSAIGDGTYLLSWDDGTAVGDTATVSGQLGDWRDSVTVELKEVGNVITQQFFSSFAPGGVRGQLAEVLTAWTNMGGNIYRFSNYSVGKTSTVETLSLTPHPDFWARNTDLSGVSVWNDNGGYYYTQPATLIASNLAYGAAHWSVGIGKTLAWYGRDGLIHSAKIVDQRRMAGDLCVSKISPALDTNTVSAYPILDLSAIAQKIQAADSGVAVQNLPPMPVLAMSQAQRGWIMRSALGTGGGVYGIFEDGAYIRNSRNCAVGGDSGHPVFVSTDGVHLVLVGSYWTPNGISVPGEYDNKELVRTAAAAMGADPDAVVFEAWTNWPTYLGPLTPGGGGGGGGGGGEDEPEDE